MSVFFVLLGLLILLWAISGVVALLSVIYVGNDIYAQIEFYHRTAEANRHTAEGGRAFIKKIELENEYYFALQLLQEKEQRPRFFYTVTLFRSMLIGPFFYSKDKAP